MPLIDTTHRVQTPEGVELALTVAGPAPRALAWAIDAVLIFVISQVAARLLAELGNVGQGGYFLLTFGLNWFYSVAFEVLRQGRTPGKMVMDLQVVHDDGTPVRWPASVLRNFLRSVDVLPVFPPYAVGAIVMCIDRSFRRLGDLAAGTLVIYSVSPPQRAGIPEAAPQPPAISLALDEQRAVIAFAERAGRLTGERARELAAIPAPLVAGGEPRQTLERIAAWLIGRS
jgi:uncharacterized RDD family membrane protein YckC